MPTALTAWRDEVIARLELELAPVRVSGDVRALNPPCVLVGVPTDVALGASPCTLEVRLPVYLVAPPPGQAANAAWLVDHLEATMRAVDARTARASDLVVGDGQAPLPAYHLELAATIPTNGG